MASGCIGSVAEHLQGENVLLLDTLKLIDFQGVAHVILPRVFIKTSGCTIVVFSRGSLVLTSNVVFAGIYVRLRNNKGSCSFRPSLQHSST